MKKIFLLLCACFLMAMCGTPKTAGTTTAAASANAKPEVQYKDDFRAAPEREKAALLKKLKAEGQQYSVLIFTKNYKGEKVVASNAKGTLHSGYLMSNLKTGIAETIRINNTIDTKIYDNATKKTALIEASQARKHKFIYLMKNTGADNPFVITYSNTLRPLE